MAVREYWRDGDGLVHLLDYKFHITLCEGLYRMGSVRLTFVVPTCFQCLSTTEDAALKDMEEKRDVR